MLAIGCGYPDGNDFDWLRRDVAFKLACGRLPGDTVDVVHGHQLRRNQYINIASAVLGLPIYRLESDDMGDYMTAEFAWHMGERS